MISIAKLGHAGFTATDVEALAGYYDTVLGFTETERADGAVYLTTSEDHHTVALHAGDEDQITHLAFQLGPATSLEDAQRHLGEHGTKADIRSDAEPGIARLLEFQDPEGNTLQFYEQAQLVDSGFSDHGIRPHKLGHICLRAHDVPKLTEWYETVLGFKWSDWIADFFVFIRCGPDHHTLNLLKGERAGNVLHHIAYELRDWAHVQPACDVLFQHGYKLEWGPGRHGPGHNIFTYHKDPGGNVIELFTQLDVMNEELGHFEPRPWHEDRPQRPKRWTPDPLAPNRWGILPPPDFM
jgi:catechol-2,3-dioxygenase